MTVDGLTLSAAGLAFAAGVVSFLSPCVLPLLPVYLSYVSGVAVKDLERHRWRVLGVAVSFSAGFTVVFVLLGVAAGSIGGVVAVNRTVLSIVAGAVLIVAGVFVADVVRLPVGRGFSPPKVGGFLAGAAVAVAWTPCVGPVLGAILTLAGTRGGAAQGALLLLVYSLGLAVPFLLAAVAFGWVARRLAWVKRHYRAVRLVAGALLIAAGLLMVTGAFDYLNRVVPSWAPFEL